MDFKFQKAALLNGMSSNAFKTGMVLSLGWFWLRKAGCHCVYKGQDGNMDYDRIQAVMNADASEVSIAAQELLADTNWHYARRKVSCCGLESPSSPICMVQIKSDGTMRTGSPNAPYNLTIETLAGGKVRLHWYYDPEDQDARPAGFHVYCDNGSGFDLDTPDANVGFWGSRVFSWTSGALVHGSIYRFVVCSYASGGECSGVSNIVSARADSQGPAAIDEITVSWEAI